MINLSIIEGFDWDRHNASKVIIRHEVQPDECQEVFFNTPIIFFSDEKHSDQETRMGVFGKTNDNRLLTIIFTLRKNRIRVISARSQSKKERLFYKKYEQKET